MSQLSTCWSRLWNPRPCGNTCRAAGSSHQGVTGCTLGVPSQALGAFQVHHWLWWAPSSESPRFPCSGKASGGWGGALCTLPGLLRESGQSLPSSLGVKAFFLGSRSCLVTAESTDVPLNEATGTPGTEGGNGYSIPRPTSLQSHRGSWFFYNVHLSILIEFNFIKQSKSDQSQYGNMKDSWSPGT